MTQKNFNIAATLISIVALIFSGISLKLSWDQKQTDYEHSVSLQPGALPRVKIPEGLTLIELEVSNTSKSNLRYFLKVDSNIGCVKGADRRPAVYPCNYQSQPVALSKSDSVNNMYRHKLQLEVDTEAAKKHSFAYLSDAEYWLAVEVIDDSTGRTLYTSTCFYSYHVQERTYVLHQPTLDTSGESVEKQKNCRP